MKDVIPIIQAVIVGIMTLFGIVVTQSWTTRREQAKRRIELAEEVLALFYEAKEAIQAVRSPGGWMSEGSTRKRSERETPEQSQTLDRAFVVIERLQRYEVLFSNLKSKKYRFMATFRGKAHEPFDDVDKVTHKIWVASHLLGVLYWKNQGHVDMTEAEFADHRKGMDEQEAVFWSMPGEDVIPPMVEEAIRKIEVITDMAAKEYVGPPEWWRRLKAFIENKSEN